MGRRKIEIARIESARNRAVTFLKRKNGLFKKAYELGVLCSVDVAVIVFEERPGHDHKLYSYCSGDIREIIARHVHFDGESETRGVADFSNNASKANETADAEDDEEEEDEPAPPPKTAAKRSKKTNDDDAEYGATMSIPSPPISIRKFPKSTTIPTSSDRHSTRPGKSNGSSSQPPSKKQRTASPRDRASSDEDTGLNLPLPLPNAASYGFPPMMYRGGGGGYGLPSQPPFFPSLYDPPATYRSQAQYDPGMYHQLLRAQQRAALHSQSHPNPFALDWPVHGSGGGTHLQNTQGASSWNIDHFIHSIMYPDEAPPTQAPDVGGGSGNWLDLFAGLPPPPPPLPTGGGPATATSWERGGGGGGNDLDDDGGGRSSSSKRRKRAKSRSRSSSDEDEQTADDKDG